MKYRVCLARLARQETLLIIRARSPTEAVDRALAYAKDGGLAWETTSISSGPTPAAAVGLARQWECPINDDEAPLEAP